MWKEDRCLILRVINVRKGAQGTVKGWTQGGSSEHNRIDLAIMMVRT